VFCEGKANQVHDASRLQDLRHQHVILQHAVWPAGLVYVHQN